MGIRAILAIAVLAAGIGPAWAAAARQILIFHKYNGVGHGATDTAISILKADLLAHGIAAESTKDSLAFAPANLARFGAVVFINTNYRGGAILGPEQESAFEAWFRAGGGCAVIHNASALAGSPEVEAVWPWFTRMYGTRFIGHGSPQAGAVVLTDTAHASTRGLPARFTIKDEWYLLRDDPGAVAGIRVLAKVDATSLSGTGKDRAVSWCRAFEGGRMWATTLGHDLGAFGDANFIAHVRGGISYAGGWDGTSAIRPRASSGGAPARFRIGDEAGWRNLLGRRFPSPR